MNDIAVSRNGRKAAAGKGLGRNAGFAKLVRLLWKYRILYLMILPGIAFFIIFSYFPMYGVLIAFKDFKYKLGVWNSPWVGFDRFVELFGDAQFWKVFQNTLIISVGKLIFGFPAPIILAILLNELSSTKMQRFSQSILYLPHFFSWIIIAALSFNLFSVTNGAIPKLMATMGIQMPALLNDPKTFREFVYLSYVWKTMGWGMIIYLAALTGIDPQLYEAAVVDGCGRFKQILHITLPCLSFTIVTLLVLDLGHVLNAGFDQIFNLYSERVYPVADIIDTYVYRKGLLGAEFEYGTAVGLFKSVIGCLMLFVANRIARKITDNSPL